MINTMQIVKLTDKKSDEQKTVIKHLKHAVNHDT